MKIILLGALFSGFFYIGLGYKRYYANRRNVFLMLVNLCEKYKSEISFFKNDVASIVLKNLDDNNILTKSIKNYYSYGALINNNLLSEEENKKINEFFSGLGKQDVEGEINHTNYYLTYFKNTSVLVDNNYNKYGNFSVKISAIVGLLVCILLV